MKNLIILLLLMVGTASADSLASGLQAGERAPAHNPIHVTGPDAGSTICPV